MQTRMQKELQTLAASPPQGVTAWPAGGASLTHLEANVEGPEGTVYEGGQFMVDVRIPDRYVCLVRAGF